MRKFYKKIIFIDSANPDLRLEADQAEAPSSIGQRLSRLLTLPALILGGLVGAVFFSAFLALLLIPLAIWGARSWWLVRKFKAEQSEQIIDGEFTVIDQQHPDDRAK
jgi:predicted lipid-binding transport protein (Tim44 family)